MEGNQTLSFQPLPRSMGCSNSREIEKIHEQLDAEDAARSPVRTLQRGAKPQPETTPLPGEAVAGKEDPKDKGEEAEIFEAEVKKDGPKKEEDWVEQDQVPKKKRMEEIETAQIKDQLAEVGDTVAIEEDSKQGSETAKVEEDPKPEKENETEQIEEEVLAVDWFESARLGHVPTMKQHLKKAEDDQVEHFLDSEAEERQTALHFTAQRGHFAACEWLLSMKADAGAITKKKATALHMAASFGHLKVVELLVDDPQLCSVAAADLWRCTPLHRAAEGGFSDVALVLLKKAADPQKADRDGNSPLHFASTSGCQELVEELLKRQVPLNFANNDGFSPLDLCLPFLCSYVLKSDDRLVKKEIVDTDDQDRTPLLVAVSNGNKEVVKRLLGHPLGAAHLERHSSCGLAPLHEAARSGQLSMLQMLLEHKAHVEHVDAQGSSALFHAAMANQLEVANWRWNERFKDARGDGCTAWLAACGHGHRRCAEHLRSAAGAKGLNLGGMKDRTGRKAMILAARGGHLELCKWLLDIGLGQVSERDSCQWTPLHAGAAEGHRDLVEWLLKQGADASALDEDGHTPHSLARRRGFAPVEALLRRHMAQVSVQTLGVHNQRRWKVRVELNLAERTSPPDFSPEACGAFFFTPKKTSFRADAPVFVPRDMSAEFETPTKEAPDSFVAVRSRMLRMRQLLEDESKCQGHGQGPELKLLKTAKRSQVNGYDLHGAGESATFPLRQEPYHPGFQQPQKVPLIPGPQPPREGPLNQLSPFGKESRSR
ncbi:unnamed protein product [Durusdinium trenchii]|uniref:Uncharacterized protein n=1 Tax=Durusdinium trenchii TaxID=1381693 RepID=A0ABP0K4E8_9DINO